MSSSFNFQTSTPEAVGIPSEALQELIDIIVREHFELHGILISRHEKIVAEGYFKPYTAETLHRFFSAAKSVYMIAILCLIQEGKLHLTDRACELLPEAMPGEISENLSKMTLNHLLSMATGHGAEGFYFFPPRDEDPVCKFFRMPVIFEPGRKFMYNNGVPSVLVRLIEKYSGESVVDYLRPRIFEPLGIGEHYTFVNGGAFAMQNFALSTRDMFKLALLLARHGEWEGKQLIRAGLADLAGMQHTPNGDFDVYPAPAENLSGYGWQMWRNPPGGYRFDGAMGQYAIVLPEYDMVIAMNADERGSYDVLDLIWKILLRRIYLDPIEENPEAYAKLQNTLNSLNLAPKAGEAGELEGTFFFEDKPFGCSAVAFSKNERGIKVLINQKDKLDLLPDGKWYPCEMPFTVADLEPIPGEELKTDMGPYDPRQAVVSSVWEDKNTLLLVFRSSAWLGGYYFRFRRNSDALELIYSDNECENYRYRSEAFMLSKEALGWYKEPAVYTGKR